jgi:transposase InsO family protein
MQASMSRKGNCYDNAPMESFWGSLKNELVHHQRYATRPTRSLQFGNTLKAFITANGVLTSWQCSASAVR